VEIELGLLSLQKYIWIDKCTYILAQFHEFGIELLQFRRYFNYCVSLEKRNKLRNGMLGILLVVDFLLVNLLLLLVVIICPFGC
jgi:hypothetical protein